MCSQPWFQYTKTHLITRAPNTQTKHVFRAKTQVHVRMANEIEEGSPQKSESATEVHVAAISRLQNVLVRFNGVDARVWGGELEYTKSIDHKVEASVMASFYLALPYRAKLT